jgi:hypothetical protein
MRDVRRSIQGFEKYVKSLGKGFEKVRLRVDCVEVPSALWWTFASLQSPGRVRFAAPGDRDSNRKDIVYRLFWMTTGTGERCSKAEISRFLGIRGVVSSGSIGITRI